MYLRLRGSLALIWEEMVELEYLVAKDQQAQLLVYDTALVLKRLYLCERSLVVSEGGWIAGSAPLDCKAILARAIWEDALAADALGERVFELRFPSRMLELGNDAPLVALLDEGRNAPSAAAFFLSLSDVIKPAFLGAYGAYMSLADAISDGPSIRFLRCAIEEKQRQIAELRRCAEQLLAQNPAGQEAAHAWVAALKQQLTELGGLGLDHLRSGPAPVEIPGRKPFAFAQVPARDSRFWSTRFYWPDNYDSSFPYGEGVQLQLRTAVSHLNEVWAVETAGALIYYFSGELDWEFTLNAARWVYDESRHMMMGFNRLMAWGFRPEELPLGTYIFESACGQDPIYRLGMLFFFETKNIGKKKDRVRAFASYGDRVSQRDMDFDWADEAIHASYGKRWLGELLRQRGESEDAVGAVRSRCGELVAQVVSTVTDAERTVVHERADAIMRKALELIAT